MGVRRSPSPFDGTPMPTRSATPLHIFAVKQIYSGDMLICSDKDETDVRWAFKGIQTPMGVSSYDNVQIASSNLLPSAEELQARVKLIEEVNKSNA